MSAIKKEVVIGDCRLILGDSRYVHFPNADMICCDPPYLLTSGGANDELGGKLSQSEYANTGDIVDCDITWDEVWQVFSNCLLGTPRAHIYCMANNRNVSKCQVAGEEAGFHFHNILPWDKITATPNRWFMKNCEFTILMKKGNAFAVNDCSQKQLIRYPNVINAFHPTQKPVELMANYIRQSTRVGQTVADPFMGVGTTGVAAIKEGRKFVGCEIDPDYFEIACNRIQDAYDRPDMFIQAEKQPEPKQEAMEI